MGTLNKLSIRNLTKIFDGQKVLDDVSFDVFDKEFLSILGPSGCGKTTLLRILIGLEAPSVGKVIKEDIDITNLQPSKRGMGIVFQNYALFENMNVLENIAYALKFNRVLKSNAKNIASNIVERVGLGEHINKKPRQLSGGQQQRVAIARTLALNPDIVLFDEPMSALDVDTRLSLRKELLDIKKEFGTTMIYITHDQEEAFSMSDRIMVMNKGLVHQLDTPENIIKNPADEYIKHFVISNLKIKTDALSKFVGDL